MNLKINLRCLLMTTIWLFLWVLGLPSQRCSAFEVMKTSTGLDIKWSGTSTSYLINTSGGPNNSLNAILAAMQTWTDVSGASFILTYSQPTSIQSTQRDQTNIIFFQPLGRNGTLAQNTFWYYVSTGEMIESDINLNTSYSWQTDGSQSALDVQNIATHELGHTVGLNDIYGDTDQEKTMYGYASEGETKKRTLHQDDIDGIRYLYPGSGNTSPQIVSYDANPTQGSSPLLVTFYCSAIDYDGVIAKYYFVFGDGSTQTLPSGTAQHSYNSYGSFQAYCSAYDQDGAVTSSQAIVINVLDTSTWWQIPGQLNQITAGDVNKDGYADVLGVTTAGGIYYTLDLHNWNTMWGQLSETAAGDLNGDGVDDLAGLTWNGQIYYTTDFRNWNHIPGTLNRLATGDLNGDGRKDLIGVTVDGAIYFTLDLYNWQYLPGTLKDLACADLNGDGRDDVVGVTDAGFIYYTLDLYHWNYIPGILNQLATGDLNGDGRADIVGVTAAGAIYFTLDLYSWQNAWGALKQVESADLNHDGYDDLVGVTSDLRIFYRLGPITN